jgi:hypothetical protein
MSEKNKHETEKQSGALILVPQNFLEGMAETQKQILAQLKKIKPTEENVGDYISETQAKKLLKKGTTWFWNKRTSKELSFTKVGNTIYYSKTDIQKLFDKYKTVQGDTTVNE